MGDKLGFLQATIEFALRKEEIKDEFEKYLLGISDKIKTEWIVNN